MQVIYLYNNSHWTISWVVQKSTQDEYDLCFVVDGDEVFISEED